MRIEDGNFTTDVLRSAFGRFPSGVTIVASMRAAVPTGMSASSFTSVSLEPPLVSVCVARTSTTWPVLRTADRLGVSVLGDGQEEIARTFAAKGVDRFANVEWEQTPDGAVFIAGSALWLDTALMEELPAGDHEIALLRIRAIQAFPDIEPLVFHASRYRRLHGIS